MSCEEAIWRDKELILFGRLFFAGRKVVFFALGTYTGTYRPSNGKRSLSIAFTRIENIKFSVMA